MRQTVFAEHKHVLGRICADLLVLLRDSGVGLDELHKKRASAALDRLKTNGYDLKTMPYILQLNKRDLPSAVAVDEMVKQLRYKDEQAFEAVAIHATGVFETLKALARLVLVDMKRNR